MRGVSEVTINILGAMLDGEEQTGESVDNTLGIKQSRVYLLRSERTKYVTRRMTNRKSYYTITQKGIDLFWKRRGRPVEEKPVINKKMITSVWDLGR